MNGDTERDNSLNRDMGNLTCGDPQFWGSGWWAARWVSRWLGYDAINAEDGGARASNRRQKVA